MTLETRSADARDSALARELPAQIARARDLPGYGGTLGGVEVARIDSRDALAALPVLRKSELGRAQGRETGVERDHIRSPGSRGRRRRRGDAVKTDQPISLLLVEILEP